ncbi:MAG: DnaD domain protein [Clostridia bacterium]|nr:DnaD domain protein [Clostridia bacterium]
MQYTWNSEHIFSTAALPKAAADKLKLAGAPALRVLIWLCCKGNGTFDANACARDCGGTPADCQDTLQYWVNEGLIVIGESAPDAAPSKETAAEAPLPSKPEDDAHKGSEARPSRPPMPTREEAVAACGTDKHFILLLRMVEEKLGAPLSPADMEMYFYLYHSLHLPPEVILMAVGYAVKNGKARRAYIEKTAIGWAEDGICTVDAADRYLYHLEKSREAFDTVASLCGLTDITPTVSQKEAAFRWIYEWQMPHDVIRFVFDYATEKTGKFQASYMDRVLERLHAEAITTADGARDALTQKKKASSKASRMKTDASRPPSFNIGQYETMVSRHRPQIPTTWKEDES